jgi:hypothetical protein
MPRRAPRDTQRTLAAAGLRPGTDEVKRMEARPGRNPGPLDDIGPSVTVAATGGRYFGFGYRLRPKV